MLLTNVLLKYPPKYNYSYPEDRSDAKISEQFAMFFPNSFPMRYAAAQSFCLLFFFSSLISIHSVVEHEEKVSVKLKNVMDYSLDSAASLYPSLQ